MTIGLLEAVTKAIGESDAEIGGLFKTRLTSALATGTALTPALSGTWTWDGTTTVLATDTTQVVVGNWIKLDSDGQWFEITAETPNTDVTIDNTAGRDIPTGATGSSCSPFIWDGTLTIASADTSTVVATDWIKLDSDGQYFEVASVIGGTSVTILNPLALTIPGTVAAPISTKASKAVVTLPVETTLDWDSTGKVAVGGIVYHYTGTTATTFTGVTHIAGGISRPGVFKIHHDEAEVVDLNRSRNSIDLLRRAMLVDYAEEEHLDALGRNVGVGRTGYLTGDDVTFREVVKALGYNPRGLIYGMELVLDALLGAGNYEISEDLISHPCTVFISLVGTAATVSKGKAFLKDVEPQPATSNNTVDVSRTPIAVSSVRWKNEDLVTPTTTVRPSDASNDLDEYDGDTGRAAWEFVSVGGGDETDNVTVLPITTDSGAIEFTTAVDNNDCAYIHSLRIQPESEAFVEAVVTIPAGVAIHLTEASQAMVGFFDTVRVITAGIIQIDANNFGVGLADLFAGTLLVGSAVTLAKGAYHTIRVHKHGNDAIELWVNGVLVETATYGTFPAWVENAAIVGVMANPPTNDPHFRVRRMSVWCRTLTDYWSAHSTVGQVVNPTRLTDAGSLFLAGDVGKAVTIRGATNDINNGRFIIDSYVDADNVELVGADQGKADLDADVTITVPTSGYMFQYPDDIGKKIVISGSALGNDGSYVIDSLLSMGGANPDLADGEVTNPVPERTNICKVAPGTPFAAAEVDLDWRLDPVFVNEGPGLDWEMSDAGSFSGPTLTLRQNLPIANGAYTRVLDVMFSDVLSAQILLDTTVKNLLDGYYPFYISDPLGFVRAYLDAVTAAGIIPEFEYA